MSYEIIYGDRVFTAETQRQADLIQSELASDLNLDVYESQQEIQIIEKRPTVNRTDSRQAYSRLGHLVSGREPEEEITSQSQGVGSVHDSEDDNDDGHQLLSNILRTIQRLISAGTIEPRSEAEITILALEVATVIDEGLEEDDFMRFWDTDGGKVLDALGDTELTPEQAEESEARNQALAIHFVYGLQVSRFLEESMGLTPEEPISNLLREAIDSLLDRIHHGDSSTEDQSHLNSENFDAVLDVINAQIIAEGRDPNELTPLEFLDVIKNFQLTETGIMPTGQTRGDEDSEPTERRVSPAEEEEALDGVMGGAFEDGLEGVYIPTSLSWHNPSTLPLEEGSPGQQRAEMLTTRESSTVSETEARVFRRSQSWGTRVTAGEAAARVAGLVGSEVPYGEASAVQVLEGALLIGASTLTTGVQAIERVPALIRGLAEFAF